MNTNFPVVDICACQVHLPTGTIVRVFVSPPLDQFLSVMVIAAAGDFNKTEGKPSSLPPRMVLVDQIL